MNVERRAGGNGSTPEVELVWPKAPSALLGLLSMPLFTFSVLSGLRNSSTFPWPSSLQSWSLSCAQLFVTHWTVDHQVPLSMGFLRQEYQSGLPFPPPWDLPDLGPRAQTLVSYVSCSSRQVLAAPGDRSPNHLALITNLACIHP